MKQGMLDDKKIKENTEYHSLIHKYNEMDL